MLPVSMPEQSMLLKSLHLFVLTTFAIVQPAYDRLGGRPAFLSDSGVGAPGLLLFTALMSLVLPAVPPLLCWSIGKVNSAAGSALYTILLYVLFASVALPICKRIEWLFPVWTTISLALAVAAVCVLSYFKFSRVRSVVTVASVGIILFPAQMLLFSPASSLLFAPPRIQTSKWKPVPVVFVVLDELRGTTLVNDEYEIDADRFPNFAELARQSTWFRNATTVYPDTWLSVPAILSGTYPRSLSLPGPGDLPQNLFSVLRSTGAYDFAVFEPVSRLASYDMEHNPQAGKSLFAQLASIVPTLGKVLLAHLLPTALQERLPEIPRLWFGLTSEGLADRKLHRGVFRYPWGMDRIGQFEHFLECLDDSPKPTLNFFHVLLPHVPWCYMPSGRKYLPESDQWELLEFDTHSGKIDFWGTDELYIVQSQQRQLLQLTFVDRLLGRLLDRLRSVGLYDKCLLIVTADHGISFQIGGARRGVSTENISEIASIPLFIKLPGQRTGRVSDRNVESVDILPTIADVLAASLQFPVDGQSVYDQARPEREDKKLFDPGLGHKNLPASIVQGSTAAPELRSRFGPGSDPDAIYRIGPHPELLGRQVSDLKTVDGPVVEIEMIHSGAHYSENPLELVPCYHEGRIVVPARVDEPVRIAVAVNGVIRGVTRTYQLDGARDHWMALIPESAFRVGDNDVRYYSIAGTAPDLQLARCAARIASESAKEQTP
jgi:hypothetical protein